MVSYCHQMPQLFHHQEDYNCYQPRFSDHTMSSRVEHPDFGAGGNEDSVQGCTMNRRVVNSSFSSEGNEVSGCHDRVAVKTDVQISFPDYDNLGPAVRLDRLEEKTSGGNKDPINTAYYDNYAANNTGSAESGASVGAIRGGSRNSEVGGFESSDRYKGGDNHRYFDLCGNVSTDVRCEAGVREKEMGNDLFGARADCVSDARAGIGSTNPDSCDSVSSTQNVTSELIINTLNVSTLISKANFNDGILDSSNVTSVLANAETDVRKCDDRPRTPGSNMSAEKFCLHSILRKTKVEENDNDVFISPKSPVNNNYDSSGTGEDISSPNGLLRGSRTTSATTSPENDNHSNKRTGKETRFVAFEDRELLLDRTQPRTTISDEKKLPRSHKTSMATINITHVPKVTTPTIVITPSTPRKKASKSSSNLARNKPSSPQIKTSKSGKLNSNGCVNTNKNSNASRQQFSTPEKIVINLSDMEEQRLTPTSDRQDGINPLPPTSNSDILKDTCIMDISTTRNVSKPDNSIPSSAGTSGYFVKQISKEAKSEIQGREDNHKGVNMNSTFNIEPAGMSSSTATDVLIKDTHIYLAMIHPPATSNTEPDSDIDNSTHNSDLCSHEKGVKETTGQDNHGNRNFSNEKSITHNSLTSGETNTTMVTEDETNNAKNDVFIPKDVIAVGARSPKLEEDELSYEEDVESLLGSHYTVIPGSGKSEISMSSSWNIKIIPDIASDEIEMLSRPVHHSNVKVDQGDEDIYAIPIPKSQRKATTSQSKGPTEESLLQECAEELPPKPPRSPNVVTPHDNAADISIDYPVPEVQTTSPIKKSSTIETLHQHADDDDYSNIPKYGKYDFFSLGRRPKLLRTNTVTGKRGAAINLEMMLRFRRQSLTDIPSTTATDQNLSVDDILRSCSEFEESNIYYRTRTCSDSTQNSSWYSMSVFGVSQAPSNIYSIQEKEKPQNKSESTTTTSILKKRNSEKRENRSILKTNKSEVTGNKFHASKSNSEDETRPNLKNSNKNDNCHRRQNTSSKVVVQPVTSSEITFSDQVDLQRSTQEPILKISPKQSSVHFDLTSQKQAGNSMEVVEPNNNANSKNGVINDCAWSSSHSPRAQNGSFRQHSDYDTLENSPVSNGPPSRSSCLPTQDTNGMACVPECESRTANTGNRKLSSDFTVRPVLEKQTFSDTFISKTYVGATEIKLTPEIIQSQPLPQKTTSLSSAVAQKTSSSSEPCQELIDNHNSAISKSEPKIPEFNIRKINITNSDIASSTSPLSVWSDSADDSSPGVTSSLSGDVFTDGASGGFQFPNQGSQNCFAQLEALEALKWLRAAGFPQYAQMYNEHQFPVDMRMIEQDHDFLDQDSLKSLFRRLQTLNKYAGLSLDNVPDKKVAGEEEDEYLCALSDKWEYHKSTKKWSRKDVASSSRPTTSMGSDQKEMSSRTDSHDAALLGQDIGNVPDDNSQSQVKSTRQFTLYGNGIKTQLASEPDFPAPEVHSTAQSLYSTSPSPLPNREPSDRSKAGRTLFGKTEGITSKKSRRQTKRSKIMEISGPIVEDSEYLRTKLERLNCVDISPTSETIRSPSFSNRSCYSTPSNTIDRHTSRNTNTVSSRSPLCSTPVRPEPGLISNTRTVSYQSSAISTTQSPTPASDHNTSPRYNLSDQNAHLYSDYNAEPAHSGNTQRHQRNEDVEKTTHNSHLEDPDLPYTGRFPLTFESGYKTSYVSNTDLAGRNKSDTFRDDNSGAISTIPSKRSDLIHRKSVYDNLFASDSNLAGDDEPRMIFPGIYELRGSESGIDCKDYGGDSVENNTRWRSSETQKQKVIDFNHRHQQRDSAPNSRQDSSASPKEITPGDAGRRSIRERSVSFDTSLSSGSPRESIIVNKAEVVSVDSTNHVGNDSKLSVSKSRGIFHSSSADSYFPDRSVQDEASFGDDIVNTPRVMLQKEYDDLDIMLKQLYQNIDNLTNYIGMERPADPKPKTDLNDSFGVYGTLDLDTETSLSGGEGSTTTGSSSEDPESTLTDQSRDSSLDNVAGMTRERKDSGVGHSLTRAPSERRRKKIRWNSFQKSHRPNISSRDMQINSLSISQMVRLQKLSLLKLTSIMEKCLPISRSGWNWMMPRFLKKQKTMDFADKKVFGVPLNVTAQRTGQPLPQCVLYAMRYIRRTCPAAVGIFRKSGVKSKIQQLRDDLESDPDTADFEGMNVYNVADMLKTYFRDLPECLLTNKMSDIFRSIYMHVPQSQRLEAIQTAIALLPDENREVLQSVLLFLSDVSLHEADHQMNASNLAVCFTPTVFQLGPRPVGQQSPKRVYRNNPSVPDPREILEQKAAHECLLMMILESKKLFTVTPSLYQQLQAQSLSQLGLVPLQDIGNSPSDVRAFGQERIQMVLKEAHDKNRGWLQIFTEVDVEVFCRKPLDECPLKEWKLIVEVEAPPIEVLHRIMHERHVWDEDLLNWSVVERLGPHSDIFQFVLNSMAPHPCRHFCVLRYWRSDLNKGACALITVSVDHEHVLEEQGVPASDLGSYYLIEPCGSGRSRLTHITRLDTRGRTPEWYTRIFGHICATFLDKLRDSFRQITSGPETRV